MEPTIVSVKVPRPAEPLSAATDALEGWKQPCVVGAIYGAIPTGILGFLFGFIPSVLRNRSLSRWRMWGADGFRSATALAVVSGLYTTVQCICQRLRMVEDGWNRGIAGCSTGLYLGWKGGPWSAAQSCLGLGFISYIVDLEKAGETPPAQAACLDHSGAGGCGTWVSNGVQGQMVNARAVVGAKLRQTALKQKQQMHQLPPVMWLGHVMQPSYFSA